MVMEERLKELAIATASIQITKDHLKAMAPVYEKELLKKMDSREFDSIFELAKQTCKRFPSVAELLEIKKNNWSPYKASR